MLVPTFVDLQGFIVNKKFIVKEVAVLKQGTVLTHYIFTSSMPWKFLTRSDRSCASWLSAYHHGLRWEDGMIPYSEAKSLITAAVFEDDDAIVYVKGREKRTWLWNLLLDDERERMRIETLNAVCEDMESLWQHGNRRARQSRRDVGPTYVSRPLLTDDARANVGSMSATGGDANHGATLAQRTLADSYLLTKLGPTLAARQPAVTPITTRRRPDVH
ncbi:hypothetical protein ALC57_13273 [Trachymyrmex cornetzi]|uniref:Uncharacterized protein n=1 Tax=Trachymyrmex cornetzi TaxID=471704 RepID=A0A151IZJ3_9HYME|nr:hypothetical protein ALC57_13273 [Trachymyrmex cornetzi]